MCNRNAGLSVRSKWEKKKLEFKSRKHESLVTRRKEAKGNVV